MDLLTGQNKANFKIWYANWQEQNDYYKAFHKLPFAMQEGVLKEYYRSVCCHPSVLRVDLSKYLYTIQNTEEYLPNLPIGYFKTYEETMKKAFKAANELMNQTTTP